MLGIWIKYNQDPVARQFGDGFEGLGCLQSCPYSICLKDARPHAIATPCWVPLPYHEKVKELDRMLSLRVIEESTSPTDWVNPMVVVPKRMNHYIYVWTMRV